jgi:hypothetical protein
MKKSIATLLSFATLGTALLTLPVAANAWEVEIGGYRFSEDSIRYRQTTYSVFFRRHHRDTWRFYGSYNDRFYAGDVVRMLEDDGYYAYTERD